MDADVHTGHEVCEGRELVLTWGDGEGVHSLWSTGISCYVILSSC